MKGISSQSYDGSTDPKDFFKSFLLQAAIFNWDDDKQAAIIPFYLKGKAEHIYNALDANKKKSIDEIKKALLTGCTVSIGVLIDAFHNRKLRSDETFSQFAIALQGLLNRAMPNLGDPEKLALLRSQLSKSLPDYLRYMINFNTSLTWEKLLEALEQSVPHLNQTSSSYDAWSGEACAIKSESTELNMVSTRRTAKYFDGTCNYCKKPGHKIDFYKTATKETKRINEHRNNRLIAT